MVLLLQIGVIGTRPQLQTISIKLQQLSVPTTMLATIQQGVTTPRSFNYESQNF